MKHGRLGKYWSWLRRNALFVGALSLLVFSLLGAAQAFFLPATGGAGFGCRRWFVHLRLVSSNSLRLQASLTVGTDPNGENKPWRGGAGFMRQRRMPHEFEFLPSLQMSREVGWSYWTWRLRTDIPYVLTLLLGLGLWWLHGRLKRRRSPGFPVRHESRDAFEGQP